MLSLETRTIIFDECQLHGLYDYEVDAVIARMGRLALPSDDKGLRKTTRETIQRVWA